MYKQPGKPTFYIVTGYVDFRCGIDALCYKLKALNTNIDLTSNVAFLIMNKNRNKIKILYWGGDGFWLIQHRLDRNKYVWLNQQNELEKINYQQLEWLLSGLPYRAHKVEKLEKKELII